jgi:dihydroorotate dehydrogenase
MLYSLLRPLLFSLDAETAHAVTLGALDCAHAMGLQSAPRPPEGCARRVMGIDFPNPVGLAAGLDKNADHIDALATLGFGFIEVGTVTPRPQPGNPRPRLFRVAQARAVVNRLGFNNAGVDRLVANVEASSFRGVLGINIGKNFDTPIERAADDYVQCLKRVYRLASYVTVNISSPNTRDLRQLQESRELGGLLAAVTAAREKLADQHGKRVPLALKIAPDLDDGQIDAIAQLAVASGIDAVIATNTTVSRDGVMGLPHGDEAGGLSGAPLARRSTYVLSRLARALGGALPIIGVGGIMSAANAADKIVAGASLVQLYTGLVYRGPKLVPECVATLCRSGS